MVHEAAFLRTGRNAAAMVVFREAFAAADRHECPAAVRRGTDGAVAVAAASSSFAAEEAAAPTFVPLVGCVCRVPLLVLVIY